MLNLPARILRVLHIGPHPDPRKVTDHVLARELAHIDNHCAPPLLAALVLFVALVAASTWWVFHA